MATVTVPSTMSSPLLNRTKITAMTTSVSIAPSCLSLSHSPKPFTSPSIQCISKSTGRGFRLSAVLNEDPFLSKASEGEETDDEYMSGFELRNQDARPCELYVCNLSRSCDVSELAVLFKPFGNVLSVEVSRDSETGESKGCGYVTMSSLSSARNAISVLDGSDFGGRELRVRYSIEMSSRRANADVLNSGTVKVLVYESPYKLYVGNLPWDVRPEILRNQFVQFGDVLSTRILYDRKAGKYRAYGFVSFSTEAERNAALSMNGAAFRGRTLVVRKGVQRY